MTNTTKTARETARETALAWEAAATATQIARRAINDAESTGVGVAAAYAAFEAAQKVEFQLAVAAHKAAVNAYYAGVR